MDTNQLLFGVKTKFKSLMDHHGESEAFTVREAIDVRYELQKELDAGTKIVLFRSNGDRVDLQIGPKKD